MAIAHCTDTQGVKKRPKVSEMHNLKLFNFLAFQKKNLLIFISNYHDVVARSEEAQLKVVLLQQQKFFFVIILMIIGVYDHHRMFWTLKSFGHTARRPSANSVLKSTSITIFQEKVA